MDIATQVDARKERYDAEAAWELIKAAQQVTTAKGKKISVWNPQTDDKEEILKQVMGPSGNLRAPTFQVGNEFVVGFNAELYTDKLL